MSPAPFIFSKDGVDLLDDNSAAVWDVVLPGYETSARTIRVTNNSGVNLESCRLVATNGITDSSPDDRFSEILQSGHGNPYPCKDLNNLPITFTVTDAGPPAVVDLLVDGSGWDVWDVTNEAQKSTGTGLTCDGITRYRFAIGTNYESIEFVLSSTFVDGTSYIWISDGGDACRVAMTGETLTTGIDGAEITETGEADGVITVGGYVDIDLALFPSALMTSALNERLFSLRAIGYDVGGVEYSSEVVGSYNVANVLSADLMFRYSVRQEKYYLPRFNAGPDVYIPDGAGDYIEDPDSPGDYILIPDPAPDPMPQRYRQEDSWVASTTGTHVEDEQNPGTYIVLASHPTGGYYTSLTAMLAASGVTFTT